MTHEACPAATYITNAKNWGRNLKGEELKKQIILLEANRRPARRKGRPPLSGRN